MANTRGARRRSFWRECCASHAAAPTASTQRARRNGRHHRPRPAGSMTVAPALRAAEPPVFVTPRPRRRAAVGAHETVLSETRRRLRVDRGPQAAAADGRADSGRFSAPIVRASTPRSTTRRSSPRAAPRRASGFLSMKGFDETEAANLDVWLTYLYLQLRLGPDQRRREPRRTPIRSGRFATRRPTRSHSSSRRWSRTRSRARSTSLTPRHRAVHRTARRVREVPRDRAARRLAGGPRADQAEAGPAATRRCPLLARRLAVTGDYTATPNDQDTTYGPELQEAVKRFQRRHGLEPDGAVSAATVAQLNVPVGRAHPADLAEPRALALAAGGARRAARPRQHPRIPPRSLGSRQGPRVDARRRRQEGHADADLQRRHDPRRVLALLERAARHRQERDDSAGPARSGVPAADEHGSARQERQPRRSVVDRRGERRRLPVPPAAGLVERARAS